MDAKNSFIETKNNLAKFEKFTNQKVSTRPETPHIDFLAGVENENNANNNLHKRFSGFMQQIIDMKNSDFLNGKLDVIEHILSKLTYLEVKQLKHLEKISLRLDQEFGLLNQFGQRLPKLIDLRLNGSNIISISNIGTNFDNLLVLQVNNCNINDLSGMLYQNSYSSIKYIIFNFFMRNK